ncbi:MAG: HlyD family efflux transporter periplasmic adaptor subunit [Gammaproteobacteria bacterium]|nr:HlyD family efflux transporter periplasmic adaptor subunit [Gammaproteobacteria bacterium]
MSLFQSSHFRTEAILALTRPLFGERLIPAPPGWRVAALLTITFLLLAAITLTVLELPRKVTATGVLVAETGLTWAYAPMAGHIEAIHVRRGDVIKAGDPLLRITHDADASGQSYAARSLALEAEEKALAERSRLAAEQRRFLTSSQTGEQQRLQQQEATTLAELKLERAKAVIADEAFRTAGEVASSGAISRLDRDRAEAMWLESRQRLEQLQAAATSAAALLKALPSKQASEQSELDTRLAVLEQEAATLGQRRLELRLSRQSEVSSPVSGQIVALRPETGSFVSARSPQIAVLPQGEKLLAELSVPSSALGLVVPGTPLRLHIESFPHAKFGAVAAVVEEVSPVLQPAGEGQSAQPFFRIRARPAAATLHRDSQTFALQPDMRLHAFVLLEQRRAFEWLFEPLLEALRR